THASSTDTVVSYTVDAASTASSGSRSEERRVGKESRARDTLADIPLTVLNDSIVEGTETVKLNLSAITSGDPDISLAANPANLTATASITDDDTATVSIAKIDDRAASVAPTHSFSRLSLTHASSTDTVVSYTVDAASTASSGS